MEKAQGQFDFHTQGVPFPDELPDKEQASERLEGLIRSFACEPGEINVVLCSDEALQKIHKSYLGQDDLTDIVTFDYVEGERISGDLFISVERIRENASELERPPAEELHRVMAHGILHLLGYKDKSEKERNAMREAEDEALREWGFGS